MAKTGCGCGGSCNGTCGSACQTETTVRPLFFAGQLLTEDDLQLLQDYVVAKNRLHNRYLFGAGVVCGFEVLCDPCSTGLIRVRPGYALDCCGNDLFLNCPTTLDVNAMIRDLLREVRGGIDCGDPCTKEAQAQAKSAGKVPLREYCLTVQYCEQKTDPVSPYATDAPCSPQACQASRVREGLTFALRCPAEAGPAEDMFAVIAKCFVDVIKLEKVGTDAEWLREGPQEVIERGLEELRQRSFEELRRLLLDLIDCSAHPTACTLRARVLAVPPPAQVPEQSHNDVKPDPSVEALIVIFVQLMRECLCMAVLPPCPPCDSLEVELACIRVQGCEVVEICNLSRQLVVSPAALRYWLGFERLERELQRFCCPERECWPPKRSITEPGAADEERAAPEVAPKEGERGGRVIADILRAMALLAPAHSGEAPHLDHLAQLVIRLTGREPEPKTDPCANLRHRVDGLQQQINELQGQLHQQQQQRSRPRRDDQS
jgi:hypothetical protein